MSSRLDPYSLAGATLRERYSIDSFVGAGRFSVVYRGTEIGTEKPVALRFLKTRGTLTSSERTVLVERLRGLVEPVIEMAEHAPAFADVLDVTALATSEGRWMPALVQTWAAGPALESVLALEKQRGEARRSVARAVELLSPVADAVHYAHARGVVHGGLSPRCLFVRERVGLVVADLGLAGALASLQREMRAFDERATVLNTLATAYAAPEQLSDASRETGPPADVYALALLVVELVTGVPSLGDDDREAGPFGAHVQPVLERALAVRPEDRYATIASFWEALRAASRVMLRRSRSSIPPPLPVGAGPWVSALPALPVLPTLPPPSRVPTVVTAPSFAHEDAPPRAVGRRPPAPPSRPTIPPHEFFAPSEESATRNAAIAHDEVESMTNPLFGLGSITARSVAPTSMDAPSPDERAAEVRLGARRMAALGAIVAVGLSVAGATASRVAASPPTVLSTPLPADVLAAAAAIRPPLSAPAPCPSGMVRVPGGTVATGDRGAQTVAVGPYCIDALEVTVDRFASCSDPSCKRAITAATNAWSGISWFERKTFDRLCNAHDAKARGNHPMNCVDWKTAAASCNARGARLPTDAEWELAARGSDGRRYPWGNEPRSAKLFNGCGKECADWGHAHGVQEAALYDADDGFPNTAPVGSFPLGASPYGLEDVVGNVWEWTSDSSGNEKTTRGGAWNGAHADGSLRWHAAPNARSYAIGFRCAAAAP